MTYRERRARRRRMRHGVQIAAIVLRFAAVALFIGAVGAFGGAELGGGIARAAVLFVSFGGASGACLVVAEWLGRGLE